MYGIVILNYKSYELTCALANQVRKFSNCGKVAIIDNNSGDDFSKFAEDNDDNKIWYYKNCDNSGYAAGNNIGLKYLYSLGYKIAFIANPDVVFEEGTTDKIASFLMKHKDYAVASCKRTIGDNGVTGQYWNIPSYKDCLSESVYSGRKKMDSKFKSLFDKVWSDKTTEYYDVEVVGGAFFGCNLDIMNKIGYMNERTFLWYEENILAFNIRKNSFKEALLLNCSYKHNHFKTTHGTAKFGIYLHSMRVYCDDCLKINGLQKVILYLFNGIGLIESKLLYIIAKIIK